MVIGLANTRATDELIKVNLLDSRALRDIVIDAQPHAIVHSAAERDCNKVDNDFDAAKKLNVDVAKHMAELSVEVGATYVYVSTDYVFDGSKAPYKEDDPPNPINKYGISKLEGEKATLKANPTACILRIPVIYGHVERLDESVVTGLLTNLLDTKPSVMSHYEIRFPTFTNDVAELCHRLVKVAMKDPTVYGIYQCSGEEPMTKYEMVQAIAEVFKLPADHVTAVSKPTPGAPRPYNCKMYTSRLTSIVGQSYTPFCEAIERCLVPFVPSK